MGVVEYKDRGSGIVNLDRAVREYVHCPDEVAREVWLAYSAAIPSYQAAGSLLRS